MSLGKMFRKIPFFIIAVTAYSVVTAADKPLYETLTADEAKKMFYTADAVKYNTPFKPNSNPDAQWYPKAGFGLFIHWGIYAQVPLNPSWSMLDNVFGKKRPAKIAWKDYYALAEKFDPKDYDPGRWMKMAKSMYMQYAVMTTKHHDGYCMWPSKYGKYNTGNYMHGRDLVGEYVKACRKEGLKVGFYFSPRDWSYNDHKSMFRQPAQHFDWLKKPDWPYKTDAENEKAYLKWLDYTVGQLSELLTRYGKIDVMWFDGVGWQGIQRPQDDLRVRNWIYTIQPQIVINPRWGGKDINPDYANHKGHHSLGGISRKIGDFYTYESKWPDIEKRNEGLYADIWFEFCQAWKGHWGHVPTSDANPNLKSMQTIIYRLTTLRSFGGNYLLNIGPNRDGRNRPDIISESKIISEWMKKAHPALIGNDPVKFWEAYSNVPLTMRDKTVYAHVLFYQNKYKGPVRIRNIDKPESAVILQTGETIPVEYDESKRSCIVNLDNKQLDPLKLGTIIALNFSKKQVFPKTDIPKSK